MNRTQRVARTIDALDKVIERRTTELRHINPYELVVATVLSAQCTDERVNQITPALFKAFPSAEVLSQASPEEIFPYISSVTYPNNKSRHLAGLARMLIEEFEGRVPQSVQELKKLPGVGEKTAQVVVAEAFNVPALAVDTHVFRVSHRIGLVARNAGTPQKVEVQLKRRVPKDMWADLHHMLIFHGRYVCKARSPECDTCPVKGWCDYFSKRQKLPEPREGLVPSKGTFFCGTRQHYFNKADLISDRNGVEQISCPVCGSMNVFSTKTGKSTKRIQDYRV